MVFCLEVWDGDWGELTKRLKEVIDMWELRGGPMLHPRLPVVVSDTRAARGPHSTTRDPGLVLG